MRSDGGDRERRLHPVSMLFLLGSAARALLLPGLVVLFASRGDRRELWLMAMFVPTAVVALVRYWNYRYRLTGEELVIREGLIHLNERHIPYGRIQNIDLAQNPVHRLFGVAEVRLETASGGKAEAVMRVLSMEALADLRAGVFARRGPAQDEGAPARPARVEPADAPRTLLRLPTRELILFGLISSRGTAVIAAGLGLLWQFDLPGLRDRLDTLPLELVSMGEQLPLSAPAITAIVGVLALIALLTILRILAALWTVVKFHGFTLRRRGEDVSTEYGLLTRVTATLPRRRIQLASWRAGPLHRWAHRCVLQVETAGGGAAGEASSSRQWLAPMVREPLLAGVLGEVLPDVEFADVDWQPVAARAWRRRFHRGLVLAAVLSIAALAPFGPPGLALFLAGAPLVLIEARLWARHAAWALTPTAVFHRSGWWTRRASVVRFSKIQTVTLRESPFDRRAGMASVDVDTAGAGRVGHRVAVRYLDAGVARELKERLSGEAGRTRFRW